MAPTFYLALLFISASAYLDGRGFYHTSLAWSARPTDFRELFVALGFTVGGVVCFQCSIALLSNSQKTIPEFQALIWFLGVILTIAVYSGKIWNLERDLLLSFFVAVCSIGWIIYRLR